MVIILINKTTTTIILITIHYGESVLQKPSERVDSRVNDTH